MNRFSKKSMAGNKKGILVPILGFVLIVLLFFAGVNRISGTSDTQAYESLQTAIHRNIVHCYAVEGQYPPSLEYMETHYGLSYDKSKYFIDYDIMASNIMPDVTIIKLEADQ